MSSSVIVPHGSYAGRRGAESVTFTLRPGFRTQAQLDTIRKIVEDPTFDFSFCTHDLFDPAHSSDDANSVQQGPREEYYGPFWFMWTTKSEQFRSAWIGKRGNILKSYIDGKAQ